MKYSPKYMNDIISKYNFRFKKNFGQNFIIDENIINSIIEKSNIDKETLVIEIGPGSGSLTYKISKYAKNVIAYEIDESVKPILYDNLKDCDNVEVIFSDFLKSNVNNVLKKYDYKKLYVIANLPYYITTPIIIKLIEDKLNIDKIVVMVQKEVGNRFKASPGSKEYGSLSVYLNYYYDIKKILDVSRNVFIPKPNVDSIVVEFNKKEKQYDLLDENLFFQLVRDSFTQKRKTIKNNLNKYNLEIINDVLKKYNLDLNIRAEQIKIEIFVDISNRLAENDK